MPEKVMPGPVSDSRNIREAVCIHTRKIFDSCKDKDCIEDLRVYPTRSSQAVLDQATCVKAGRAELLYAYINVEPISFNKGFYTVDVRYFYRISGDAFTGAARPAEFTGLAVFNKRAVLFGSEGSVKTFSSEIATLYTPTDDMPTAVVNSVDPICLHCKLVDAECLIPTDVEQRGIPGFITAAFDEALVLTDTAKRWYATIGQFSIIRLERDTQLQIPAYDYCIPDKECPGVSSDEDPCMLFSRIRFPVEEFFPPDSVCECDNYRTMAESNNR